MSQPIAFRETILQGAIGERKYVRYMDRRGHFAHLRLELVVTPERSCAITRGPQLSIPEDCCVAAEGAIRRRIERGGWKQFPMYGFEVRLMSGTFLKKYSYPEAFAAAANMAFDDALQRARLAILEPWVGVRLKVEQYWMAEVLTTLTKMMGEVALTVSFDQEFSLSVEVPRRLLGSLTTTFEVRRLETYRLPEDRRYRFLNGPIVLGLQPPTLEDWT